MAPYFGMTGGKLTFWVTVACATDMTLFGYDQGVFGGVIVTVRCSSSPLDASTNTSSSLIFSTHLD